MDNTKPFFNTDDADKNLGNIVEIFEKLAEQARNDERLQRMLNPDDDEWS